MSGCVVYVEERFGLAHLVTDGAGFRRNGRVSKTLQKVQIHQHLGAAIAPRGPLLFAEALQRRLGRQQGDFDALVDRLIPICKAAVRDVALPLMLGKVLGAWNLRLLDVPVVGYSPARRRAEAYLVERNPRSLRWTLTRLESPAACRFLSPASDALVSRLQERGVDLWASHVQIEDHGLAVMREQRNEGFTGRCDVGVFCQVTSVGRQGATTRIVERWPDVVGELPKVGL